MAIDLKLIDKLLADYKKPEDILVECVTSSNSYPRKNVSTIERFFRCELLPRSS
jgi:hypothetical protein